MALGKGVTDRLSSPIPRRSNNHMGIMEDVRRDLISGSANLSNTLRKARVLASRIKLPEFQEWVKSELGGYADISSVPDYRIHCYKSRPLLWTKKNVVLPYL